MVLPAPATQSCRWQVHTVKDSASPYISGFSKWQWVLGGFYSFQLPPVPLRSHLPSLKCYFWRGHLENDKIEISRCAFVCIFHALGAWGDGFGSETHTMCGTASPIWSPGVGGPSLASRYRYQQVMRARQIQLAFSCPIGMIFLLMYKAKVEFHLQVKFSYNGRIGHTEEAGKL